MGTWRRALPLVGWLAALVGGIVLFHAMAGGAMSPSPVTDPGAWVRWSTDREPVVVVAAVLRLLVLALAWYLVGVTTIGTMARLVRLGGLIRFADALTLPMVRRLLQSALGVGLATAMVGAATTPPPRQAPPPTLTVAGEATWADTAEGVPGGTVTFVRVGGAGADDRDGDAEERAGTRSAPVVMRLVEQERTGAGPQPDTVGGTSEIGLRQVGAMAEGPGPAAREHASHRVTAGESLWSISRGALAEEWEREPTDTEVLAYWRRTIEHNRDRLADPDNPDLLFPGDEIMLPATE